LTLSQGISERNVVLALTSFVNSDYDFDLYKTDLIRFD